MTNVKIRPMNEPTIDQNGSTMPVTKLPRSHERPVAVAGRMPSV